MIQITPQMRVLVAVEPADFRKGIDGLVRLCKDTLQQDPFSGWVFVFRNRPATAVKVLVYDGQGFWLCHKRLSCGRFPWWPTPGTAAAQTLAAHQLHVLLSGGRLITDADVAFIRQLIAEHPTLSRRALSQKLCEAWNWVQPNGRLRDMVCRGLMLALHRAGRIELPPTRRTFLNPLVRRAVPPVIDLDQTPLQADLSSVGPLRFEQVRRTAQEPLFNSLIQQHHHLGYTRPVGEHLKYLVYAGERVVAALAWSSAPHGLTCRDRFLGWSAAARRQNCHLLAYNSCYRAANWIVLGQTSGRGHRCPTSQPNRPVKLVLGYPLVQRFRERLQGSG